MTRRPQSSHFTLISLVISLAGLGLFPFLLRNPPPTIFIPWQAQLVGGMFALICLLGLIAGVAPRHCSCQFRSRRIRPEGEDSRKSPRLPTDLGKQGHHPTCEQYSGHVLKIGSRILCAGCTGLVIGAVVAILGTTLFFIGGWRFIDPLLIFGVGIVLVAVGLLQHPIYQLVGVKHGLIRFVVNALFVLGPFLLLASLVQMTNNLVLALYLLLLTLYWIFTRILMSQRSHRLVCAHCTDINCPLREV